MPRPTESNSVNAKAKFRFLTISRRKRSRLAKFTKIPVLLVLMSIITDPCYSEAPPLLLEQTLRADDFTQGVVWSPDGGKIAAYSRDGNHVNIWDVHSGTKVQTLARIGAHYSGNGLAFVNGSSQIATPAASPLADKIAVSIFDVASGKVVYELGGPYPTLARPNNAAAYLSYAPNKRILAVIFGSARSSHIGLFSSQSWQEVGRLGSDAESAFPIYTGVSFSRTGDIIAVARGEGKVKIYAGNSFELLSDIETQLGTDGGVLSVSVSPDGKFVAVGAGTPGTEVAPDGHHVSVRTATPVRIFQISNGNLVAAFKDSIQPIWSIDWCENGKYLAFFAEHYTLHLWDPMRPDRAGEIVKLPESRGSVACSPNGKRVAVTFGAAVAIYSLGTQ